MYLLRTMDGVSFTLTEDEANKIKHAMAVSDMIEVQGCFIRVSGITGIFTEEAGKQVIAKDRGLVYHKDDFYTPDELLGRPVLLPTRPEDNNLLNNGNE